MQQTLFSISCRCLCWKKRCERKKRAFQKLTLFWLKREYLVIERKKNAHFRNSLCFGWKGNRSHLSGKSRNYVFKSDSNAGITLRTYMCNCQMVRRVFATWAAAHFPSVSRLSLEPTPMITTPKKSFQVLSQRTQGVGAYCEMCVNHVFKWYPMHLLIVLVARCVQIYKA